jgi:RNA polymerase sigma-70 factor, ECF subfamily
MHEQAERVGGLFVVTDDLEREFEARLVESSRLAFRIAYSVLRHRQDAEDVAQESLVRAYRKFSRLRDLTRFRAWIVRLTWRLALDRRRADRRRLARELVHAQMAAPDSHESEARSHFETPSRPSAFINSSTFRVDTPWA